MHQRCLLNTNFTVFTKHFLLTIGTLTYRPYPPPGGKQLSYINLCFCNQLTSIFCTWRALSISPVMSFLRFECCINLADSYRYETQHTWLKLAPYMRKAICQNKSRQVSYNKLIYHKCRSLIGYATRYLFSCR